MRRISAAFVAVAALAALVLAVVMLDTEPSARTVPVVQLPSAERSAESVRAANAMTAGWGLPSTWCGTPADADVEHVGDAERAKAPTVKVIYARPSDAPDRFAAAANELQRMASRASLFVAQESGGGLTVRWDVGTRCSQDALDLERVVLPRTRAEYLSQASIGGPFSTLGSGTFWLVQSDLMQAALPLRSPAPRNYLVLVDGLRVPGLAGRADQPSTVPSADHLGEPGTTYMGNVAVVFGRDAWNSDAPVHELWHTLSAVAYDAPNATSGAASGHCTDGGSAQGVGTDLLCYSEASLAKPPCPGAAETVLDVRLDCHNDDYFSMPGDLAPGSWLAQHPEHNTANSVFLAPCAELPVACGRMPDVLKLARAGHVPAVHQLAADTCGRRCRSHAGRAARARALRVVSRWESWGTFVVDARLPRAPQGTEWRMCVRWSSATTRSRASHELRRSARSQNCVVPRAHRASLRVRADEQLDTSVPDRTPARWVAPVIELRQQKSWRLLRSYNASGRQTFATTR